jgi:hypothetical protein
MNQKSTKAKDLKCVVDLRNELMGEQLAAVPLADDAARVRRSAEYHSAQAMAAARQMRSSREKEKTGQIVCHHLRMMLTSEPEAIVLSAAANDDITPEKEQSQYQLGF